MLQKETKAPYFEGTIETGERVSLNDYAGKKLVLYFYPKDSTPGCTAEACSLRDNYERFLAQGYEVVADTDLTILKAYEAWGEKKMYGKVTMGTIRTTYVIDENGIIVDAIGKVNTKAHAEQIL